VDGGFEAGNGPGVVGFGAVQVGLGEKEVPAGVAGVEFEFVVGVGVAVGSRKTSKSGSWKITASCCVSLTQRWGSVSSAAMEREVSSQRILARVRKRGVGFRVPSMSTKSAVHGAVAQAGSSRRPSMVRGVAGPVWRATEVSGTSGAMRSRQAGRRGAAAGADAVKVRVKVRVRVKVKVRGKVKVRTSRRRTAAPKRTAEFLTMDFRDEHGERRGDLG
jgi:hypothetical protein